MKKSKITVIAMFSLVALFLILFVVFFNVGDSYKSVYDTCVNKLASPEVKASEELTKEWTAKQTAANASYTFCAVMNYVCSILAIASLGVGLALSDKFKAKEEKDAEDGIEVLVKPGTKKRKAEKNA